MPDPTDVPWPDLHGDHFRAARVLITGGAGFIGSHLADALVQLGAQVLVLDDLSGGSRQNLSHLPLAEFIEGSLLDQPLVNRSVANCRYVFHLAALGSVPASVERPRAFHDVNTTGTLNVLEAARAARVQRVVFAASSSAYGDNGVPWIESMPARPQSPYAATKVAGEALLRAYSGSLGLDTASLRYFNIFGPRQNANSAYAAVIAAFAKALLSGNRPTIYGDGTQSRDFTYVANAVHANLLAARHPQALHGEVLNVGCGSAVTVSHLATLMAQGLGRNDLTPLHAPERAGDLKHSYADLKLAKETLGYEPIVSFEAGLTRTMDWYRAAAPRP
jgi:UDP-glucose 4-epimerase